MAKKVAPACPLEWTISNPSGPLTSRILGLGVLILTLYSAILARSSGLRNAIGLRRSSVQRSETDSAVCGSEAGSGLDWCERTEESATTGDEDDGVSE